ncbi:hypothetical protein [Tabrizicola thermarum]|uniref:hypothetical protein n=1 Tax=Tabrizicola thermarum TaxID=2670345 RepID=UPI000FFBDC60|nr:hypothetical protein [Tabrizicola thermarum]
MKNLFVAIIVASLAILGFYAYQSSQKVADLQKELAAKESALVMKETEKEALEKQVADLQAQVDKLGDKLEAAIEAAAAAPPQTEAPAAPPAPEVPAAEAPAPEVPATEAPATNP